jgi:hypothetical protein
VKKFVVIVIPFFVATNFHKNVNYFIFEMLKKKILDKFQRIIEHFTQKIVNMLSKIWGWDPGSGKNLFRIPDPAVKKAPDPDPQHWQFRNVALFSTQRKEIIRRPVCI